MPASCGDSEGRPLGGPGVLGQVHVRGAGLRQTGPAGKVGWLYCTPVVHIVHVRRAGVRLTGQAGQKDYNVNQ